MANPIPLQCGQAYHVYNRGNNRERIFIAEANYHRFLALYAKHVHPIADTFAYCLLPNHFHFLLYINDLTGRQEAQTNLSGQRTPSQCFSNLCNAYAKNFNWANNRTGALFQRPFGRVPITSDAHLTHLVTYIHRNPQKHGWVDDFGDWPYSSYQAHLSDLQTRLQREEVLAWFGGLDAFAEAHDKKPDAGILADLAPGDEDWQE